MKETWKPISALEGYLVSDQGRVKQCETDKVIEPNVYDNSLYVSVKGRSYLVHILVARAFLDDPGPSSRVQFIDGNRCNCKLSNLRWGSISEETKKMIAEGRRSNPAPYTGIKLRCEETGETYTSIKQLCEALNLPRSYVTRCIYSKEAIKDKLYVVYK